jgi:hypothetical protein
VRLYSWHHDQWWRGSGPPGLSLKDSLKPSINSCLAMLSFNISWAVSINERSLWCEIRSIERVSNVEKKSKIRIKNKKTFMLAIVSSEKSSVSKIVKWTILCERVRVFAIYIHWERERERERERDHAPSILYT